MSTKKAQKLNQRKAHEDLVAKLKESIKNIPIESISKFEDLPLSENTKKGLKKHNFLTMTDIQQKSLAFSLKEKDILGAAKTGSGKTLAFLIPILETLYRERWTSYDGLGALVISPTRELSLQIFEVLKKVGEYHGFSAGLVIGGNELKQEQEMINRMNILICTPGRLLQHMDQTIGFDASNLKVLVLDEADRILDMGFSAALNAIIDNLPLYRQTLLFSATQTKSVKDLARLSLKDPEYVSVHDNAEISTPDKLLQYYLICNLPEKLDILYSFIKSHLKCKALVFLSSCKQVRFVYETFCQMQPGIPLLCLHGKQKQAKRMGIFYDFCNKNHAIMFATDIAARGLDFPAVNWVIQLDCPENAETYIHRVGRTARFDTKGKALLFLLPSEKEGMLKELEKSKVPITQTKVNTLKSISVANQLQAMCSKDPEIKYLAQKTFISYARSVFLQKDKTIFNVNVLPLNEFAESLGLAGAPKIKFVKRNDEKNVNRSLEKIKSEEEQNETSKPKTRVDKMFQKKNTNVLSEHYAKLRESDNENESEEEEDLFTIKRKDHELEKHAPKPPESFSRRDKLKEKLKYKLKTAPSASRIVFDDDGNARNAFELQKFNENQDENLVKQNISEFIDKSAMEMSKEDVIDRKVAKEKLREKRIQKKIKEKKKLKLENESEEFFDAEESFSKRKADEMEQSESEEDNNNLDTRSYEEIALSLIKKNKNK